MSCIVCSLGVVCASIAKSHLIFILEMLALSLRSCIVVWLCFCCKLRKALQERCLVCAGVCMCVFRLVSVPHVF